MFKSNQLGIKKTIVSSIAFALIITISACGSKYTEEIERTNELATRLDKNKENLNLDIGLFTKRIEYIERVLESFKTNYNKEITKELGDQLSKLNVLRKVYKRNTGTYQESIKEQAELEAQITNLVNDLENGQLTKEEFKSYYKVESDDVSQLVQKSSELNKSLYELESEYKRLMDYLEPRMPDQEL